MTATGDVGRGAGGRVGAGKEGEAENRCEQPPFFLPGIRGEPQQSFPHADPKITKPTNLLGDPVWNTCANK